VWHPFCSKCFSNAREQNGCFSNARKQNGCHAPLIGDYSITSKSTRASKYDVALERYRTYIHTYILYIHIRKHTYCTYIHAYIHMYIKKFCAQSAVGEVKVGINIISVALEMIINFLRQSISMSSSEIWDKNHSCCIGNGKFHSAQLA